MDFSSILSQLAPMANMMKSGGNPMSMIQGMMGQGGNKNMMNAFSEAQRLAQSKNPADFEQYVRGEFQKAGMDVDQVRKMFGM